MSACPHCNGTGLALPAYWPPKFRENAQHTADLESAKRRLTSDSGYYLSPERAHLARGVLECAHQVSSVLFCRACDQALVEHGTQRVCVRVDHDAP